MNTTYSVWEAENSHHSINRSKERAGLNKKKAEKMMELARERWIGYEECKWSLDRNFLISRTTDATVLYQPRGRKLYKSRFGRLINHTFAPYLHPLII